MLTPLDKRIVPTLAAALALVGLLAPSASATFKGRNGLIAYSTGGGEANYVVWTVRPDGSQRQRLIEPSKKRFRHGLANPQWSADGERLLFGGHHHLDRDAQSLWYSTASGKRLTRIPLGLGGTGRGPHAIYLYGWAWAPDGRRVVFAAGRRFELSKIYTISIDGTHRRALRRGWWPEWSGDGRHIIFNSRIDFGSAPDYAGRKEIAVMRPDGSEFRRLTTSTRDTAPSFSPDGRKAVFVREFPGLPIPRAEWRVEWHIVDIASRQESLIATHYFWSDADQAYTAPQYCAPHWAPNGKRLGAFRNDRVGVDLSSAAFATFDLGGKDERTAFRLPHYFYPWSHDCDFSWQPL
jgi:dipeptidyl aminopeptidase/acylaminoacyl peptidase